eukprot:Clim_evm17s183 gene=Clim_evmTU17s183
MGRRAGKGRRRPEQPRDNPNLQPLGGASDYDNDQRQDGLGYYEDTRSQQNVSQPNSWGFQRNYLVEEDIEYFKRIERLLDGTSEENVLDDKEDRTIMVENVLEQINGREVDYSCQPDCCRVIEKVLQLCSGFHLRVFLDRIMDHLLQMATDRFGSHVLQTLLHLSTTFMDTEMDLEERGEEMEGAKHGLRTYRQLVADTSQAFLDMMTKSDTDDETKAVAIDDLIADPYANHVLRSLIFVSAGMAMPQDLQSSQSSRKWRQGSFRDFREANSDAQVDMANIQASERCYADPMVQPMAAALITTCLLGRPVGKEEVSSEADVKNLYESLDAKRVINLAGDTVGAPLVSSCLICAPPSIPLLAKGLLRVLCGLDLHNGKEVSDANRFDMLIKGRISSHVMQKVMEVLDKKAQKQLYGTFLKQEGKIADYAMHPNANFVLQTFIVNLQGESILKELVETICSSDVLPKLLFHSRSGVVSRLCAHAESVPSCQETIVKGLISEFSPKMPESSKGAEVDQTDNSLIPFAIMYMRPYEHIASWPTPLAKERAKMDINGCLILQSLCRFSEVPRMRVLQHIQWFPVEELIALAFNKQGSHVLEAMLGPKGLHRGESLRKELIKRLKPHMLELALNRYGSHVLDALWDSSDMVEKEEMAKVLAPELNQLQSTRHGKFLSQNYRLPTYTRSRENWAREVRDGERRKRYNADTSEHVSHMPAAKKAKAAREENEIDVLFAGAPKKCEPESDRKKKKGKGPKVYEKNVSNDSDKGRTEDKGMDLILQSLKQSASSS